VKVLHISSAKTWRGGERQVQYLTDGLQDAHIECHLMAKRDSELIKRCNIPDTQLLELKKGILSTLINVVRLKKYCAKHKIDLIHGHDSHAHSLLWIAYKMGLTTPSLITRRLNNPIKSRSRAKYNAVGIKKIICISLAVKVTLAPQIEDKSRLVVIHSAIDLRRSKPSSESTKKVGIIVAYVAALTPEKDHFTFIKSAKELLRLYPEQNYSFMLVGAGPMRKEIERLIQKDRKHFTFTGFREDMEQVYLDMDILLHTSKSEALGTAILDAMKYEVPVVASQVGGIPEIIDHNHNGFLCTPGDFEDMAAKVHRFTTDRDLAARFTKNATAKLNDFDKEMMVEKTIALYKRILKS